MSHCSWKLLPLVENQTEQDNQSSYPPLLIQLLHNRGITSPVDISSFIASDRSLMADPSLFPDMEKAVSRISKALHKGETIGVYGDFDADGITATALQVQGITLLGGKAVPYIPHRQTEGHGLSTPVLKKLHENPFFWLLLWTLWPVSMKTNCLKNLTIFPSLNFGLTISQDYQKTKMQKFGLKSWANLCHGTIIRCFFLLG